MLQNVITTTIPLLCYVYEILGSSAVQDQEDLLHVFLTSIWLHNRYNIYCMA